ncbi:MAG: putative zinc protease [Alphaproteobacteria bacterium MarineAlpha4_Bin2]|nr:MAG: putative zinc protease [Alphaproteobacteria bacterium MarineAlpha4_Bin2]
MIRGSTCFASILAVLAFFTWLADAAPVRAIEIQRVKSPGGIEAWLVRDTSVPILSIEFSFRGGRTFDPLDKSGLSNLLSGLLDEGAGTLDSKAFQTELENKSIQMSFGAGRDAFSGSLKTLNEHRSRAIELLSLALTEPRFDKEPVERMRQQALVALKRGTTNPDYIAGRTWATAVFGNHPYSRPSLGNEKSLQAITRKDLLKVIKERFARNLLIVGVTGDITPAKLGPLLDQAFGGLPERTELHTIPEVEPNLSGDTYVVELDVPQSAIRFGQTGLKRNHPDWYTSLVMNYVLGSGSFSSRLFTEVRDKRGLAYSVGAGLSPMRYTALISGHAGTNNENVADSLKIIQTEWHRMRKGGVSANELAHAKSYLTGSFPLRLSSTDRIARTLVAIQYHDLGIDYISKRSSYINAVTQDDIANLAQHLLDPDALTFVIVGKPKGVSATAPAPKI